MNRAQRRAAAKQAKTDGNEELESKIALFSKLPDECLTCQKAFDKKDKEMVTTWNVVVREKERSVKIYCPTCWNNAVSLLKQCGVPIKDEGQDQ
mgnify:CR=1 FL=1